MDPQEKDWNLFKPDSETTRALNYDSYYAVRSIDPRSIINTVPSIIASVLLHAFLELKIFDWSILPKWSHYHVQKHKIHEKNKGSGVATAAARLQLWLRSNPWPRTPYAAGQPKQKERKKKRLGLNESPLMLKWTIYMIQSFDLIKRKKNPDNITKDSLLPELFNW